MRTRVLLAVIFMAAAAGCREPQVIDHPKGEDQIVIRMDTEGGLAPVEQWLGSSPLFSLYGKGRVITLGPQIEIYPPPAMQNVVEQRVAESAVQKFLLEARKAGLIAGNRRFDKLGIADAETTVFTVEADKKHSRVEVYALGLTSESGDRAALQSFRARLLAIEGFLSAADVVEKESAYRPTKLQIITVPHPPGATLEEGAVVAWPLRTAISAYGELFEPAGQGARCGVVSGADMQALRASLERASRSTVWTSGGSLFRVFARPLMPDESDCVNP